MLAYLLLLHFKVTTVNYSVIADNQFQIIPNKLSLMFGIFIADNYVGIFPSTILFNLIELIVLFLIFNVISTVK